MFIFIEGVCLLLVTIAFCVILIRQQHHINELETRVETLERR